MVGSRVALAALCSVLLALWIGPPAPDPRESDLGRFLPAHETDGAKPLRVVVLGGSGQVGFPLVRALLACKRLAKLTVVSRRPLPEMDALGDSRVQVRVVDLDNIEAESFSGHDAAFMLQGHGRASQATKEDLLRVDATVPIGFARACKRSGIEHFSLLSSIGADPKAQWSPITRTGAGGGWYMYVKGVLEQQSGLVGFRSLTLVRPAGIYPGNANTPAFVGWLNHKINPFIPRQYTTASALSIAVAMVNRMMEQLDGSVTGTTVIEGGGAVKDVSGQALRCGSP